MRVTVQRLDEAALLRNYPIADRVPGWFFRMTEQSAGVWRVEGTDLCGRKVSDVGTDENRVLASCVGMATEISRQMAANAGSSGPSCVG